MIASLVISWLLDKYKKFKLFQVILCISGTVLQALFTFLLELAKKKDFSAYAIGLVLYTLVNMIVVPFYTLGMNYACEITYPVGESINGGIMMTMSQLSGCRNYLELVVLFFVIISFNIMKINLGFLMLFCWDFSLFLAFLFSFLMKN